MRKTALLLLILCAGCASGPTVTLDRYRGVLRTHFDGIPDRSALCAILTNRSDQVVEWIGLRVRAYPTHGEKEGRWTSLWVYEGRMEPGQSRAVRFVDPPVVDEVELQLRGAGSGPPQLVGRPLKRANECSEPALQRGLAVGFEGRTAPGLALYSIVRRNDPVVDVRVAREPGR